MHPLDDLFHGDMHMDDGNILKKFQKITMHIFQEIDPHHLQPFLSFLDICASIC